MSNSSEPKLVGHVPAFQKMINDFIRHEEEVTDFLRRYEVLSDDFARCVKAFESNQEDHFWRRMLVKNLFALLEGIAFGLKRMVINHHVYFRFDLSLAELAMLREEKFQLLENGETKVLDKNYQKFVPNLLFALRMIAKMDGCNHSIDTSMLSTLRKCEEVRNSNGS